MDRLRQENRGPARVAYTLAERDVLPGSELEYHTPLGWVRGCFEWSGSMFQWARLIVNYQHDENEIAMIIVLPPGARCRWAGASEAPGDAV